MPSCFKNWHSSLEQRSKRCDLRMSILPPFELDAEAARARAKGLRVVLATGCFDVLHVGHVRLLGEARRQGDILFVCINDDASVRRLKGPGRPINPGWARSEVLAALRDVDFVSEFSEPTPDDIIRRIQPHVFVKGADYRGTVLPEASALSAVGARLHLAPFVPSFSSTAALKQQRKSWQEPERTNTSERG